MACGLLAHRIPRVPHSLVRSLGLPGRKAEAPPRSVPLRGDDAVADQLFGGDIAATDHGGDALAGGLDPARDAVDQRAVADRHDDGVERIAAREELDGD